MRDPGLLGYVGVFLGALTLGLLLVPLMLRVATSRRLVDEPGGYKVQESAVPYLGGAAIALSFLAAVGVVAAVVGSDVGLEELWVLLGVAAGLSVMGLVDDLRPLSPWPRLAVIIVSALVLYGAGVRTTIFGGGALDVVVTVVWIVGVTNAMNLLDNMDGLSSGVAAIAAFSFAGLAAVNGQYLVASLGFGLAGASLAFLRHNRPPASIYMGDSGSLFLGVLLAVLGLKLRFPSAPPEISALVPILVLGVPLLDTALVVVTRVRRGVSPFRGGRDHVSHRLVRVGLSVPAAVSLIAGGGMALGVFALVTSRLDDVLTAYILFGVLVALAAFIAALLARVPAVDTADEGIRVGSNVWRAVERAGSRAEAGDQ